MGFLEFMCMFSHVLLFFVSIELGINLGFLGNVFEFIKFRRKHQRGGGQNLVKKINKN
jgi:hypothetical protein